MQILETYPRDELFQISIDDLEQTVAQRPAPAGAPPAAAVPAPRRLRPLHVVPGLPAARPLHHRRSARRWRRSCSRPSTARASTTRLWSPSRCWPGCTSWSGSTESHAVPDVDPAELEARLVAATRSWDDDFADALRDSVRGGRGGAAGRDRTPTAFPEAYKEDLPATDAVARPAPARGARRPRATSTCSSTTPPDAPAGERRFKLFHVGRAGVAVRRCCRSCSRWASRSSTSGRTRSSAPAGPTAWVYDFGLRYRPSGEVAAARTPGRCSRTRSPRCGAGRPRATASTRWSCAPGSPGGRRRCCGPTRSTCGRPARRSARPTSRSA